ncbi:MAG: hypothetical protein ACREXS_17425 [Gammaproteobacteria bacterium]
MCGALFQDPFRKLQGFYRSRYGDASGEGKILACTQFESADARRAFPCWDEPAVSQELEVGTKCM